MLAFTVVKCYHIKQIKFLTNQEDSSMYAFDEIKKADSEIADAIQAEMERQNSHLELIASENWVSKAVMAAMGSPLTNKYAEGYPTHGSPVNISGKYFNVVSYGVNDEGVIDYDKVREIAVKEKPKMIIAGASAYARIIDFKKFREIADEVGAYLMVDMAHIAGLVAAGLHPSPIPYADVTTTTTHKTLRGPRGGLILCNQEAADKFNFNKAVFPGIQGGPLEHVIAGKAVCFKEALEPEFAEYQKQIIKNAQALSKGLIGRGVKIISGGTDNHLMLIDLRGEEVTGKELEKRLDAAHITCNKNTVPNDPRSPFVTSGVRLGTPAVTTRGLKEEDMDVIAECIALVLQSEENIEKVKGMVAELTAKYPLDM